MTTDDDAPTVRHIADAVGDVPGVTGLYGGVFGEIATYLPGGRISGVVLADDACDIHIIVDVDHDIRQVAADVRAVAQRLTGLPTTVTVEDIAVGPESLGTGVADGTRSDISSASPAGAGEN
ncbi:hypothetical protein QSJ19_00025 [Gordonia sp. ABSL11-1]|uniref:hypothetical protein n=1 Tax=Gordonia sp. ABSL11-1 TaxID=3053924 RepID=UPI00257334BC|nr:hypothetical protein [Gordonia sp. ABSL11-1]MDL9943989.1 hypothetical protein [Gordonia sp. ABSL11-1]